MLVEIYPQLAQTPLTTNSYAVFLRRVGRAKFVDTRVCQVGKYIVCRSKIEFFCAKPHQPLVVNVNREWIERCNENVQPQVELVTGNQKRVGDVLLNDCSAVVRQIIELSKEKYSPTPGLVSRLANPQVSLALLLLRILRNKFLVIVG